MRLINKRFEVHNGAKGYWEVIDRETKFVFVLTTRDQVRRAIKMSFVVNSSKEENWGYHVNPMRWILP